MPGTRIRLSSFFPVSTLIPGTALSLAALGYAALAAFVALDMASRGVSNGIIALNAYGAAYVGVRLVIGNLPDRLGPHRIALWSALVEALGLILIAMATNLAVAVIGGLVMGTGLSLLFPSLALLVINRTEASQQGAALGAFTFWDIGVAVGGPLAGLVAAISYPAIFWVMAGCAVLSAALSASGMRRPKPVPAPSGATMRT
ncbi:MAG TPA: MFS transporter [Streptosporangiaceae bacterium]|nr:MFS transporter [Streptosporangiaceae bacterium]